MSQALHDALRDLLNAAEGLMHPDARCSATMAARLRLTSSMDAASAALAAPISGVLQPTPPARSNLAALRAIKYHTVIGRHADDSPLILGEIADELAEQGDAVALLRRYLAAQDTFQADPSTETYNLLAPVELQVRAYLDAAKP